MELINSSNKDYLNNMLTKVRKAELCVLCFYEEWKVRKQNMEPDVAGICRQYGLQFLYHNTNKSNAMMSCGK